MTSPMIIARVASSRVTGIAFLSETGIGSFVKMESPGLRLAICQSQIAYCSWYGRSRPRSLRSFASSFWPTLPDSPMRAISASPGMTRIKPKTISDESSRTGTASRRRRITYFCMAAGALSSPVPMPSRAPLLVHPGPRQGRRPVPIGAAKRGGRHVAHVRLEDQEAVVVGHPHAEHLVEFPVDDLLGDRPLLATIGAPAQLGRQLVDGGIVDAEEVLRRLRVHVLVRPLVQTDRVAGLEPPGHPVPLAVDVAPVVGRVVELGDLDVDVEVLLELLLHELHLRRHLREVLVVEQRRLEAVPVARFRQELLRVRRAVLPPGAELRHRRHFLLVVHVRNAPPRDTMPLEDRLHLLLAVDGHRDGSPHP